MGIVISCRMTILDQNYPPGASVLPGTTVALVIPVQRFQIDIHAPIKKVGDISHLKIPPLALGH